MSTEDGGLSSNSKAARGGARKILFSKTHYTHKLERGHKMKILFCVIISLIILSGSLKANVYFEDGLLHTINYTIDELVVVDYDKPGLGTTVEIINGGWVKVIEAYYDSKVKIYDGGGGGSINAINSSLYMYGGSISGGGVFGLGNVEIYGGTMTGQFSIRDSTQAYIYNCSIGSLIANGDKEVFIYDGEFNKLSTQAFSIASVFGGQISEKINAVDESFIKFYGSNFYVNGNLMQYGQSARIYGIPGVNQYGMSYLGGTINGVLSNGDLLNVPFYIYDNSDITFVPEPATILLLSLGIIFLRRR
jgi:hypothetical protein